MYSESIKYLSHKSNSNTNKNKIRNTYFKNRSCLANVLDFLAQEVVIIPGFYFSYIDGPSHMREDNVLVYDYDDVVFDQQIWELFDDIGLEDGYHLSIMDDYITIVSENRRSIFTNKDMEGGDIFGTIIWVQNYQELVENFSDKELKKVSKAIIHPILSANRWEEDVFNLDLEFFLELKVYKPEIIFKYNIDTYMSNICWDVYKKLKIKGLNGLVDQYIKDYEKCSDYDENELDSFHSIKLCKCGRLRPLCSLDEE
ncbi:hypothetical protein CONCODRAFT_77672 [Conidiobolus coronatus NRRL 28638]|uniref:Uncharacterized protein n=1 Tax=Conidiobolus coronatus (strain ATCC 28846 / CBS 209.66 / NRRL 28638) TaxID=796925 RepID=A0A137PCN2_CONC2|nr:hypothetical protein CONCODRAFT_77672 [Conidiobolus coronatus NRRL 28638]|eukprot:KXN72735.1 hypothetical protein CONCODRAFT_77672 [Conidiobolus coronatus NRRL 28638]